MRYSLYVRKSSDAEDRQVASVESQIDEMQQIAKEKNLKITKILKEEKSAKAPGRPVFNQLLLDIKEGKTDGILCWRLNRLARNPIDGGEIIWLLQQNIIKHIVSSDREYKPEDNVLLMNVEFGMANQFIIDLRKDTKRGIDNKHHMGWAPIWAAMGYKNDRINPQGRKEIFIDKKRFPLVRKLWDMLLTDTYSTQKIWEEANKMGLTNRRTNKSLHISKIYNLFNNVFYTGKYKYGGKIYQGKHTPMITDDEFERGQAILHNNSKPRKRMHTFTFTGLLRCGECGGMITAEEKFKTQKNGNKHHYVYYHCTKRKHPRCRQGAIRAKDLRKQVNKFLNKMTITEDFKIWGLKYLRQLNEQEDKQQTIILNNLHGAQKTNAKKLTNLIGMRLEELIDDADFKKQKELLETEKQNINKKMKLFAERSKNWLELAENAFDFAVHARYRFNHGTIEQKKIILKTFGSNLFLMDKKVNIYPMTLFEIMRKSKKSTKWVTEEIRTPDLLGHNQML